VAIGPFTLPIPTGQRAVLADDPMLLLQALSDSQQPLLFVTDAGARPLGVLLAADVNRALQAP
jgi:hypothetical protein